MKKVFYWLPRIIAIAFIIFISMFALDVFAEPRWPLALLMHLIPSFILVILTIISWKYELVGGLLFLVAGLAMIGFFHSVLIAVPAIVVGILFLICNHLHRA